jgi:methionyl-tRNA formyltransferase
MIIDKIAKLRKSRIGYLASRRQVFSSLSVSQKKLNVVFFGTDLFSIKILSGLNGLRSDKIINEISVVTSAQAVTKNKKNALARPGRDLANFRGNQIMDYCTQNHIVYYKWNEIRADKNYLDLFRNVHVGVVASFGHLIPSSLINIFP